MGVRSRYLIYTATSIWGVGNKYFMYRTTNIWVVGYRYIILDINIEQLTYMQFDIDVLYIERPTH